MKRALIVGGDSCIGTALYIELVTLGIDLIATTRRTDKPQRRYLDLAKQLGDLPLCDTAFLCAGIKGFKECERDPMAWRVNVDGMLAVGRRLMKRDTFVVYVSTDAVEWSSNAYARQRAMVELGLQSIGEPAIMRCERFDERTARQLAQAMIAVGETQQAGVHHWKAA